MQAGTQVGAYRVVQQIGEGGMGSVWLAEHAMLGRRAAIKVLHGNYSTQAEIVTRFFNEARAATAIADPGIVQIFDFGYHTDGSAYIVMELLEGETLDKRLARLGRLPVGDALRILRQVATSLGAAHSRGIIHRDLKPDNIFLVRDMEVASGERAKLVDFGIAKLVGDQSMKTLASAVLGTPTYMSPEQCRGAGQVDQRSDVYALGCVLFTLVVGTPPFDSPGIGEIISMHLREPAPPPSSRAPGIPPEVDQLVLRCMAKDPDHRFSSANEVAMAIGALLGSSPNIHAAAASYGSGPMTPMPSRTTLSAASGAYGAVSPPRRSAKVPVILGLIAISAGGGVIIGTRGGGSSSSDQPGSAAAPAPAAAPPVVAMTPVAPPPPSTAEKVTPAMKDALGKFAAWAKDHPGAACPDAKTLGVMDDPWGHALQMTCSDQPGHQIAGAMSSGPDGVAGTGDDVASWQLGNDVTDVVHGPRWVVTAPKAEVKPSRPAPVRVAKTEPAPTPIAEIKPIEVAPPPPPPPPEPTPAPAPTPARAEPPRTIAPTALKALLVQSTPIDAPDTMKTQMARDEKKSASAVVKVCISDAGAVYQASIMKASGYPAFDEHVVAAVRGWRYKPYAADGHNVPACSAVAVSFTAH